MFHHDRGEITFKRRLKRSISPDLSIIDQQKLKTTKISLQINRIGSNKENSLKRCQSEMILRKNEKKFVDPLWENLLQRTLDERFQCEKDFLRFHPTINTKMRSILFDWLIEVCEVYHLHRETYHLAIALLEQFLSQRKNFPKQKFQLLGVTSLFVAAKIEEIYPPRLSDFSYVTDQTCNDEEILQMELDLMTTLNWNINPVTSINWLLIYLQVDHDLTEEKSKILQYSMLSQVHRSKDFLDLFSNAARLLDFCSLDIGFSRFSKNVLAAAAILSYRSNWNVQRMNGLKQIELNRCREWIQPFHDVLATTKFNSSLRSSTSIPIDEIYSIQLHQISLDLLEKVEEIRQNSSSIKSRPLQNLLNQISLFPSLVERV